MVTGTQRDVVTLSERPKGELVSPYVPVHHKIPLRLSYGHALPCRERVVCES